MATKGDKETRIFKVVNARKAEVTLENATRAGQAFQTGDTVRVSFKGVTLPVSKISGVYNPQMPGGGHGDVGILAHIKYDIELDEEPYGDFSAKGDQYTLATANSGTLILSKPGEYVFGAGRIVEYWWGRALGTDKTYKGAGLPMVGGAPQIGGEFSSLPEFTVSVEEGPSIPATSLSLNQSGFTLEGYVTTERDDDVLYPLFQMKAENLITATVTPANADTAYVTWETTDPEVAWVDYDRYHNKPSNVRRIHTGKPGTATIIASLPDGKKASTTVTVVSPEVTNKAIILLNSYK